MTQHPRTGLRSSTQTRARGPAALLRSVPRPATDGGRVLPFRRRGSGSSGGGGRFDGDAAQAIPARTPRPLPEWPAVTAWCVFAWCVAATRLRLAVVSHEVFGVDATLAFLVAVVLPLLCAKSVVRVVRHAARRWVGGSLPRESQG